MTTFKKLGLSDNILKSLEELGFNTPSEIQAQAIPRLLTEEIDFIGLAQTGTGKTAAFGIPLLELIDARQSHTQALVLAPTRELGQQIAEQLEKYSKYIEKINVLAVYGGAAITNQIRALKNPQHIIIATPGRLIDLIKRKAVKLDKLAYLVLDEADEMLNMGFKDELDEILSFTPESKKTWLFSATMPAEIKKIVKKYMENPFEVRVNAKNEVNENIEHHYVMVRQSDKEEALIRFLDINPEMRGLVFCRTRQDTQLLAEALLKKNYKADALHGDLSQQQRDRVMKRFKTHDLQVLIATDVAARGIDVNDLTHVFHYSLPDETAYYTHRSGRTARAGKEGISVAFISGREGHKIRQLENQLSIKFKQVTIPDSQSIMDVRIENWMQGLYDFKSMVKVDVAILERVNMVFGNVTKEELLRKLILLELDKLDMGSNKDLNQAAEERGGGGGYDRRGGRKDGGRDSSRGGYGRDRNEGGRNRFGGNNRGEAKVYHQDRGDRGPRSGSRNERSRDGGNNTSSADRSNASRPKRRRF